MKHVLMYLGLLLICALTPAFAGAAQYTAYVEPFKIVGATGDAALPASLQTLLSSRLSGEALLVQDVPAGAQILVKGSLIQFGKVFSVDVAASYQTGQVVARAYEIVESKDDLPKALGKVAEKLTALLAKGPQVATRPVPPPQTFVGVEGAAGPAKSGSDIIRPQAMGSSGASAGVGRRMNGMYIGMAPLRTLANGERELVLLRSGSIHVVRQGAKTDQIAEARLGNDDKALTVDTVDLNGDGVPEIYLTVIREFELASQVWIFKDNRLARVADNLPFYFRSLTGPGETRKLYGQQMGRTEDYYGPVAEVVLSSKGYELGKAVNLPSLANIFNFNFFTDREGSRRTIVLHPDGFLVVFTNEGEELWRSNDKYGGSEVYFARASSQDVRFTGSTERKIFIEQRIVVTGQNEILVPRNGGTFVIGSSRNYSKDSLHAVAWNGSVLDELWHTKEGQSYLADFFYDEAQNDLVLLEVVKREGFMAKGASVITVKKVE